MKSLKIWASVMSVALVLASCGGMSNTAKGSLIGTAAGGAAGTGVGALIGHLVGGSSGAKKGAIIGAAAGAAVGVTTGALIGHKMDKAAAAAKALENAKVESIEDSNGLPGVKVTFDNGILFTVGKSDLKAAAKTTLKQFANDVLNTNTDIDVAICGFASSDGSEDTNLKISQNRADAVKNYLTGTCKVAGKQVKSSTGYGENPEFLVKKADGSEDVEASRRVEVYLLASDEMIKEAEAQAKK
ncbi:MAG: OmpA family protein [Bacteroidaceae bacterium]|nr:OmpA family protein [Bacteroidaceae bacterium]